MQKMYDDIIKIELQKDTKHGTTQLLSYFQERRHRSAAHNITDACRQDVAAQPAISTSPKRPRDGKSHSFGQPFFLNIARRVEPKMTDRGMPNAAWSLLRDDITAVNTMLSRPFMSPLFSTVIINTTLMISWCFMLPAMQLPAQSPDELDVRI